MVARGWAGAATEAHAELMNTMGMHNYKRSAGVGAAERAWDAFAMTEIEYQARFIWELTERSSSPEAERWIPFIETVEQVLTM